MTQKTKSYIAIATAASLGISFISSAQRPVWSAETAQQTEQQNGKETSITPTHGFMNGAGTSQSSKTPEFQIKVSGSNSKTNANACGSNLKVQADHESHVNVTIICNNGDHNNIKVKNKINHHVETKHVSTPSVTMKKQESKPVAKQNVQHEFMQQHYAQFVPGDTMTISLRAQRILPQGGIPAPAYAAFSPFNTSDVRMFSDGHLAVVIWTQMSQGPIVIETPYIGPESYYLAQAEVKDYMRKIKYNTAPLINARNSGFITQLEDLPESKSPANVQSATPQYGNTHPQYQYKQQTQPQTPQVQTQQYQQRQYPSNGTGYNTNGYFIDVNEELQNMQRN